MRYCHFRPWQRQTGQSSPEPAADNKRNPHPQDLGKEVLLLRFYREVFGQYSVQNHMDIGGYPGLNETFISAS